MTGRFVRSSVFVIIFMRINCVDVELDDDAFYLFF